MFFWNVSDTTGRYVQQLLYEWTLHNPLLKNKVLKRVHDSFLSIEDDLVLLECEEEYRECEEEYTFDMNGTIVYVTFGMEKDHVRASLLKRDRSTLPSQYRSVSELDWEYIRQVFEEDSDIERQKDRDYWDEIEPMVTEPMVTEQMVPVTEPTVPVTELVTPDEKRVTEQRVTEPKVTEQRVLEPTVTVPKLTRRRSLYEPTLSSQAKRTQAKLL